jgi:hypothetical protein
MLIDKKENDKSDKNDLDSEENMRRYLRINFYKINYLGNLLYYENGKEPREVFHRILKDFFIKNFKEHKQYKHIDNFYQICKLQTDKDFIFGKLWKLKEKVSENFKFNGNDYVGEPINEKDYIFNYFFISLKTHHIVIQDRDEYASGKVRYIFQKWFDEFTKTENSIDIRILKDKTDFIKKLKDAHKIIFAKFVVYPSNFDFDEISEPLDKALRRHNINKLTEEMESKDGLDLDLEGKPNIISSAIAQSLRGNGKEPIIKTENEKGKIEIITQKMKQITRQLEETDDVESIKSELKNLLEDVLKELK